MEGYRIIGVFCLFLLAALSVQSLHEAPLRWGNMPSLDYVIKHPGEFEGLEVIVDGTVTDVVSGDDSVSFTLSPLTWELGRIRVEAPAGTRVTEGRQGVNVRGVVAGGVIYAEKVSVSDFPWYLEFIVNIVGLSVFLYYGLGEWAVSARPPYIRQRGGRNA